MRELDVRYALFLMPLFYVILPFLLSGTFLILGGVTLLAFISGAIILIVITNLNLGGQTNVLASGAGANVGMGSEGGYSLFVIVIGGLFYIGAQIAQFITPILNIFLVIINAIISFVGWIFGISTTGLQTSLVSGLGSTATQNLGNIYPLGITVQGISVFGALDIIMASLFILSLYFMVSSRGQ
jgi:hypothetical protein